MFNKTMKVTTMNGTYHVFDFDNGTYQRFSKRPLGLYDSEPVPYISAELRSGEDADYMFVVLNSGDYGWLQTSYITSVELDGEETDWFVHGPAILAGVNVKYSLSRVRKYNG